MSRCNICRCVLNSPLDPTSKDCGGDCLKCMAIIAGDPDCIRALEAIEKEERFKQYSKDLEL